MTIKERDRVTIRKMNKSYIISMCGEAKAITKKKATAKKKAESYRKILKNIKGKK